ncbi:MAG TPA: SUMF1/EgtB/PvdO family nonheme iron enzyme [Kiritimatiellia bacterium]|nr:SUMF1/EgtB/PvdO family nonheme iron enzyme [Kiritimatiellia bacterium]
MKFPLMIASLFGLPGVFFATAMMLQGAPEHQFPANSKELLRLAVWIPPGEHQLGSREPGCYSNRKVNLSGFYIWPVETPEAWWVRFREEKVSRSGKVMPAERVSYHDAMAFCSWMSEQLGVRVRLPTVDEWEAAARAGTPGVAYHWGWGSPVGKAVFATNGPKPIKSGKTNPIGLWNMCGNMAEWCLSDDEVDVAPVMGGSWAEKDFRYLRISHRMALPKDYRDRDVGFRIVVEAGNVPGG